MAASSMLKPLNQATRKAKILNSMIKAERFIRDGVYLQASYSDTSRFEILNGNVLIAKHGKTVFVNAEHTASSLVAGSDFPIRTRLELIDYPTPSGSMQKGIIYQVANDEKGNSPLSPLGALNWPESAADKVQFISQIGTGSASEASYATVSIPKRLGLSITQTCESGFLRGIRPDNTLICWEFQGALSCPTWSVPVGYRMNDSSSKIEVLCQKLNKLSCPALRIPISDPNTGVNRVVNMPNFLVLNEIALVDLYPPRTSSVAGKSQCESIIDLGAYSTEGNIPLSTVTANSILGATSVCPDINLYKNNLDGSCQATFDLNTVNSRSPANIAPSGIDVQPASQSVGAK